MNQADKRLLDLLRQQKLSYDALHIVLDLIAGEITMNAASGRSAALHLAAKNGHVIPTRALIEKGANIEASDDSNKTPLHLAAQHGHLSLVRLLLEKGAHINVRDKCDNTPLHWAIHDNNNPLVVQTLLEAGGELETRNNADYTLLHCSILEYNFSAMNLLFEHGADIQAKDGQENSGLHLAVKAGNTDTVRMLLEIGAKVEVRGINYNTPLYDALASFDDDVMLLLLAQGASIWAEDNEGRRSYFTDNEIIYGEYAMEWQHKIHASYLAKTREELMHLLSVMLVENPHAIPEPLIRAKIMLDKMPLTNEIDALYETVLAVQRPPQTQSLAEARTNASKRGVGLL